jgi:Flp pilus assembly pilin Flp
MTGTSVSAVEKVLILAAVSVPTVMMLHHVAQWVNGVFYSVILALN